MTMLNPGDRVLLFESLRPPDGYTLDRAVGTSYSLDLMALLAAPLAFTFFDWEDQNGRPTADPVALLEAVRRNAQRIHLFCQATGTKAPPPGKSLLAYLESCVIDVTSPDPEGVFHPKIWCLRYVAGDLPVMYRLICLTRNLTFDRSWDTALVLNGQLADRQRGYAANRPVGEFLEALPALAVRPVGPEVEQAVRTMADEVRRVQFELPPDFDAVSFWPLGLSTKNQSPFPATIKRALVMSPFVSVDLLREVFEDVQQGILISRPDQLAELPRELLDGVQAYVVDPAFDEVGTTDEGEAEPGLAGLHAKLFVIEEGRTTRLYTGSANATNAAFGRNVEFLVELQGRTSRIGIDALLQSERGSKEQLSSLLRKWTPPEDLEIPDTSVQRELERRLAKAGRAIATAGLCLEVQPEGNGHSLSLVGQSALNLDRDITIRCWPATLQPELAVQVRAWEGAVATFPELPLQALTGFMAFELKATVKRALETLRFVVNLPLNGAPEDRLERLLAAILSDKEQVRRLLWLLLAGDQDAIVGAFADLDRHGLGRSDSVGGESYPLFEELISALAGNRGTLAEVGRLVESLARTDEGRSLLPDGLLPLWGSLKAVMEQTHADE